MTSVAEIQDIVRGARRVRVRGGGSKPALSRRAGDDGAQALDATERAGRWRGQTVEMSAAQGVLDYLAEEYTFTARAGTPIADVAMMLAEKGQYLPFDPPLGARGATLGGTVAAGLSGAGRYRYGGIRDFLIGVRFIDGQGQEIRGGAAVVKNAAGFDFPKLFVGSLGRLGILTELTFKIFPQPPAFATVAAGFGALADLLSALHAVTRSAIDLHAVDFAPTEDGWTLWARIGGLPAALEERARALQAVIAAPAPRLLFNQDDDALWRPARSMAWLPDGMALVKVPLTPQRVPAVEAALSACAATPRRYSVGGNLLWLGWPDQTVPTRNDIERERPPDLHSLLLGLDLQGLQLIGRARRASAQNGADGPLLGRPLQNAFLQRIAAALDPAGKFDP